MLRDYTISPVSTEVPAFVKIGRKIDRRIHFLGQVAVPSAIHPVAFHAFTLHEDVTALFDAFFR
jgi:hypothetical protein